MEADVKRALHATGVKCNDEALLAQLAAAAKAHSISASDLADRYEVFLLNRGDAGGTKMSADLVDAFRSRLARECVKTSKLPQRASPTIWSTRSWDDVPDTQGARDRAAAPLPPANTPHTPVAVRGGASSSPLTPRAEPSSAFKTRSNGGQVVCSLNGHLQHAAPRPAGAPLPQLLPQPPLLPSRFRYMMEGPEVKVAAIDARIADFASWLKEATGDEAWGELAPVDTPAQEDVCYVGRMVADGDGPLAAASLQLEGGIASSGGARAPLDLSLLPSWRVFRGQVVGIRGFNPTGGRLVARELWTHAPPPAETPAPPAAAAAAMEVDGGGGGEALSVVVAAGPFTCADDLAYAPLEALLEALSAQPPHLLLLVGPFVDAAHEQVASGMLDVTFAQLLSERVAAPLATWARGGGGRGCAVALVPAVADVTAHPVLPTPPLALPPDAGDALASLQNPSQLLLRAPAAAAPAPAPAPAAPSGEGAAGDGPSLRLAVTSADVLRHLGGEELARAPGADRLAALASHLLGQRHMYPLFPPPPAACLDTSHDRALRLAALPQVLVLPSDLAPFAKLVAPGGPNPPNGLPAAPQVVAINPGRLAKGSGGGTYARLSVAAGQAPLAQRCRVDILRV